LAPRAQRTGPKMRKATPIFTSPTKSSKSKLSNYFSNRYYNTFRIFRVFEQLSSSSGWSYGYISGCHDRTFYGPKEYATFWKYLIFTFCTVHSLLWMLWMQWNEVMQTKIVDQSSSTLLFNRPLKQLCLKIASHLWIWCWLKYCFNLKIFQCSGNKHAI